MQPAERAGPAHRTHRTRRRRARTLGGALGVTLLGALLPGAGYVWTGRRLGYLLLVPAVAGAAYVALFLTDLRTLVDLAVDPVRLRGVATLLAVAFVVWAFTVVTTYLMSRPPRLSRRASWLGSGLVLVCCIAVALPVVQTIRITTTQADLVNRVFTSNQTATVPRDVTADDPWGGRDRVNLLLLGGDGGVGPRRASAPTPSSCSA